jgi:predicted DNA-binding protein (UPF0251 family)
MDIAEICQDSDLPSETILEILKNDDNWETLKLLYIVGLSTEEAAQQQGITPQAVNYRVSKIKNRIREAGLDASVLRVREPPRMINFTDLEGKEYQEVCERMGDDMAPFRHDVF